MDDASLISSWQMGLVIAAVIVAAAAALLIAIWWAARRILRMAAETLEIVESIKHNTQPIWTLHDTATIAEKLLAGAESIRGHGAAIAHTLEPAEDEGNSHVA